MAVHQRPASDYCPECSHGRVVPLGAERLQCRNCLIIWSPDDG